jgi:ribosomal-protein-alanine N-acetyltransferase
VTDAPILRTPRAELRPLTDTDVDAVHALWVDAEVRRYLWDDVVIPRDRAGEVVAASTADFVTRGYGLWGVYRDGGDLIGFTGARPGEDGLPELLYGFRQAWWGQGLATECASAVLDHLFGSLGVAQVIALTDAPNAASVRVMERLGMAFERRGDHHGLDTIVYRLADDAWRARRIVVRPAAPADEAVLLSLTRRLADFPRPPWRSALEIERSDHSVLLAAVHHPSPESLVLVAERPAGQPGGMATTSPTSLTRTSRHWRWPPATRGKDWRGRCSTPRKPGRARAARISSRLPCSTATGERAPSTSGAVIWPRR